jgi:hypothetical protein
MGGGGPGTTTNPNTGLVSSAPVLQGTSPMDTFAGSRAAIVNDAQSKVTNQGLSSVLQSNPIYADAWAQYSNALAANPTVPPLQQGAVPVGFNSAPYADTSQAPAGVTQTVDANGIPHRGAVDPAIAIAAQKAAADEAAAKAAADAKAAEVQKPITETGTKIWPPANPNEEVHSWLTANPHWATAVEVPDKGPPGTPGNSWYQPKGAPL